FRAHRYEKMTPAVGRHEENGGSVFHPNTEVVALTLDPFPIPNGRGAGTTARIAPLAPPAVWKEPRDRLPSEEQRAAAMEMLRRFCPPFRALPDGAYGSYSDESNTTKKEKYGTGN